MVYAIYRPYCGDGYMIISMMPFGKRNKIERLYKNYYLHLLTTRLVRTVPFAKKIFGYHNPLKFLHH